MKRIGITQRVVYVERIKERRDVLDQRWYDFSDVLGIMFVPIPNNLKNVVKYVEELKIDGLVFSGGNNIGFLGKELTQGELIQRDDVAIERDVTEINLIDWAEKNEKSIIGICRGMQVLNVYYGGTLSKVDTKQHVAKDHSLELKEREFRTYYLAEPLVNSYHNWGIKFDGLAKPLKPLAMFEESEVEAFRHQNFPFFGIMWHPERYFKFRNSDLSLFRKVFHINQKMD